MEVIMQRIKTLALAAAMLGACTVTALASQGPGASQGTAGPLAQWLAFASFIGFASLGVIFSRWDDGTYGDL
jgi:hypothetical protein